MNFVARAGQPVARLADHPVSFAAHGRAKIALEACLPQNLYTDYL